ncbi:MAG TPA: hypothetical protein VIG30_00750 [Ktedonobacterales bacterium]
MADWGTRLKAAWRGDVSDADLGAMFAATGGLDRLHQALEDRRLAAQIDHPDHVGQDWQVILAVGALAAPLWLADALVALAGTFYDTETQSHPDRSAAISASTHDLVATLLAPVTDLIAEVTAALADPSRPAALTAPLRVGPGGDVATSPLPSLILAPYAQGLSTGTRRVHTAAATSLAAAQQAANTSPAPGWLVGGLRRLDGELQAAGARLEIAEVRLTPLLEPHRGDQTSLAALCRDLWTIVDAALVIGQFVSDPYLLPDARGARRSDTAPPATPTSPPTSPPPKREQPSAPALPRIAEGAPSPRDIQPSPPAVGMATRSPHEVAFPTIVEQPDAAPPAPQSLPTIGQQAHVSLPNPPSPPSLPSVGEPYQPPARAVDSPAASPPHASRSAPNASPSSPSSTGEPDGEPTVAFPDIG